MDNDNTHTEDKSLIVELPKKNIFKENWLKTDICCEKCGQVIERQKGITKQNIKRLFSIKFDMNEFIWTLVIILMLFSAWAYKTDMQVCIDYVKENQENFVPTQNPPPANYTSPLYNFNLSTIMITNNTG